MERPVFLRLKPRGAGIDTEGRGPLGSANLSMYLNARGEAIGYKSRISYYSIRRRVTTDLARCRGPDSARMLIRYKPNTFTLEEYFLELGTSNDATVATLDQEIGPGGHALELQNNWAPLATDALPLAAVDQTRGPALTALTQQLILQDPACPGAKASRLEIQAYRKRVRNHAREALVSHDLERQRDLMTLGQLQARRVKFRYEHADSLVR